MLTFLQDWLIGQGLSAGVAEWAALAADVGVVLALAYVANVVTRRYVVSYVRGLASRSITHWDDHIARHRVLIRLARVAPAVVIYYLAVPVLGDYPELRAVVRQLALIYMIGITTLAVDGALNAAADLVKASEKARGLPVTGVAQVAKLILYGIAAVSVLSLVLNRSPLLMLSGIGAASAVTMLIFRDAILGFVAGIQLTVNNMVHRGDWIEMPSHGVDGDVLDVGLTTVKVQNFDKTVVTIPTYALVGESFKNWRGMSESGGRRIKRAINIDMNSVRFCDEEMLAHYTRIRYIAEYVEKKRAEVEDWNAQHGVDRADYANGRRLTNLGTFRAYIVAFLRHHPMVRDDMTFLIRQLDPTEHGLPIEIYVFSRDQDWVRYEAIQADIFDHLLAIVPQFDLRVFQSPSGAAVERALGAVTRPTGAVTRPTGAAATRSQGAGAAARPQGADAAADPEAVSAAVRSGE